MTAMAVVCGMPALCFGQNVFGHALVPDMNADASIQEIKGVFYCNSTTDGMGQGLRTAGAPVVWKSKDFVHWSFQGRLFPDDMQKKYWAPSKMVYNDGKWYLSMFKRNRVTLELKPDRLSRGRHELTLIMTDYCGNESIETRSFTY